MGQLFINVTKCLAEQLKRRKDVFVSCLQSVTSRSIDSRLSDAENHDHVGGCSPNHRQDARTERMGPRTGHNFPGYPHGDMLSPTRLNLLMLLPPPKIMLQSGDQSAHMILGGHFISKTYHVGEL